MTAFETVWDLLKMPIVPGSLHEKDGFPTAFFDDPISGERLLMQVQPDDVWEAKTGYIFGANQGMNKKGRYRSKVEMSQHSDPKYRFHDDEGNLLEPEEWVELERDYESTGSRTSPKYQRRGYATALYDLLAYLIAREGDGTARILPALEQEEDGSLFWENAEKTGKATNEGWRVRDDL